MPYLQAHSTGMIRFSRSWVLARQTYGYTGVTDVPHNMNTLTIR